MPPPIKSMKPQYELFVVFIREILIASRKLGRKDGADLSWVSKTVRHMHPNVILALRNNYKAWSIVMY